MSALSDRTNLLTQRTDQLGAISNLPAAKKRNSCCSFKKAAAVAAVGVLGTVVGGIKVTQSCHDMYYKNPLLKDICTARMNLGWNLSLKLTSIYNDYFLPTLQIGRLRHTQYVMPLHHKSMLMGYYKSETDRQRNEFEKSQQDFSQGECQNFAIPNYAIGQGLVKLMTTPPKENGASTKDRAELCANYAKQLFSVNQGAEVLDAALKSVKNGEKNYFAGQVLLFAPKNQNTTALIEEALLPNLKKATPDSDNTFPCELSKFLTIEYGHPFKSLETAMNENCESISYMLPNGIKRFFTLGK